MLLRATEASYTDPSARAVARDGAVNQGIRQGERLVLFLFKIVLDYALRQALKKHEERRKQIREPFRALSLRQGEGITTQISSVKPNICLHSPTNVSRCKMFFTAHFRKKTKKKPLFSEEAHFSGKAASRITAIFWRTHFSATAAKNDPLGWERKRRHPAGSTKASQKISARAKNFFKKTLR